MAYGSDFHEHSGYARDGHTHDRYDLAGVARDDHRHDRQYADTRHDHDGDYVTGDEMEEINARIRDLAAAVAELERDRAAMLRRMRQLEETLSLPTAAADIEDQAEELDREGADNDRH